MWLSLHLRFIQTSYHAELRMCDKYAKCTMQAYIIHSINKAESLFL